MANPVTVRVDATKLNQIIASLPSASDKLIGQIAFGIQGDAQQSFGSGPDGQTYKRGKITHVASSPNFPPNTDTGNLINSAFTRQVKQGTWMTGFMADYAAGLEFGTPHIAPRPFLYPAVFRAAKDFAKRFGVLFK